MKGLVVLVVMMVLVVLVRSLLDERAIVVARPLGQVLLRMTNVVGLVALRRRLVQVLRLAQVAGGRAQAVDGARATALVRLLLVAVAVIGLARRVRSRRPGAALTDGHLPALVLLLLLRCGAGQLEGRPLAAAAHAGLGTWRRRKRSGQRSTVITCVWAVQGWRSHHQARITWTG